MGQPPTIPILAAPIVRAYPSYSQAVFNADGSANPGAQALLGAGASLVARFDIARKTTDPNQFLGGTERTDNTGYPDGIATPFAIGPWLDAMWTSTQVGTVTVDIAVDYFAPYQAIYTIGIVANVTDNIVSFRVPSRFVRLTLLNTAGVAANVQFGVYVRSS